MAAAPSTVTVASPNLFSSASRTRHAPGAWTEIAPSAARNGPSAEELWDVKTVTQKTVLNATSGRSPKRAVEKQIVQAPPMAMCSERLGHADLNAAPMVNVPPIAEDGKIVASVRRRRGRPRVGATRAK